MSERKGIDPLFPPPNERSNWNFIDWSAKPTLQQARQEAEMLRARLLKAEKEIELLSKKTWCPFCKKSHIGGDSCLGHYP
jgi:hypothetical protein